jgi:hypothetical protein
MTVLTHPGLAQPGHDRGAGLRPVPWRRMAWVTWRQHRALLLSVPAVLGAIAVFLLITGLKVHHDYAAIASCQPNGPNGPNGPDGSNVSNVSNACSAGIARFNSTDWTLGNTVLILMHLIPVLIGAFAGAPLLARELETGTFRYAWTQGLGRKRWVMAQLALLGITVTALAGALGALFAWFFRPFLPVEDMNVLAGTVFETRGIAFAAWTLAAFAIGVLAGMLLRRVIPALAVTLGVYLALSLAAWDLRKYYPVALVTGNSSLLFGPSSPSSPWVLSTFYTGAGGKPASPAVVSRVNALFPQNAAPKVKETVTQVLAQHGITQWWRYIPVSRFWPMQLIEGGWLLALSVLLMAATVWLVRRRVA